MVKESDQLRSKGKQVKRIYQTTIHRQVADTLNKRFGYASSQEVKQKAYLPFYDFRFEEALQAVINVGVVIMGKKGKYKTSSIQSTLFFNKLRKQAKKSKKKPECKGCSG